jgi:hypothetical protein
LTNIIHQHPTNLNLTSTSHQLNQLNAQERNLRDSARDAKMMQPPAHAAHAGIFKRPPVNHGDLMELERKLDDVNKKLKNARGSGRP